MHIFIYTNDRSLTIWILHPQWSPPDVNVSQSLCFVQHFRAMYFWTWMIRTVNSWANRTKGNQQFPLKTSHMQRRNMLAVNRKKKRKEWAMQKMCTFCCSNSMESRSNLFVVFQEFVYFSSAPKCSSYRVYSGPLWSAQLPRVFKWHKRFSKPSILEKEKKNNNNQALNWELTS